MFTAGQSNVISYYDELINKIEGDLSPDVGYCDLQRELQKSYSIEKEAYKVYFTRYNQVKKLICQ